jgi:hypothetical protein
MSMFSWLFSPRKSSAASLPSESSGLSRVEPTRPAAPARKLPVPLPENPQAGNRKHERLARREMLYAVVRDAMSRAGVLSSGYKFKVLSLDTQGRQFLIMMDVARGFGEDAARLSEIEALIAQSARARHEILVSAVYWRMNEHVAIGLPQSRPQARPAAAAVAAQATLPPIMATPAKAAVAARPPLPGHDPLREDEVAAFKRALAMGASAQPTAIPAVEAADPAKVAPVARSYTLLTGYEDTEMTEGRTDDPDLSGTQYGQLN